MQFWQTHFCSVLLWFPDVLVLGVSFRKRASITAVQPELETKKGFFVCLFRLSFLWSFFFGRFRLRQNPLRLSLLLSQNHFFAFLYSFLLFFILVLEGLVSFLVFCLYFNSFWKV